MNLTKPDLTKNLLIALTLLLEISSLSGQSPAWKWARNSTGIGTISHDEGRAIAIDSAHSAYIGGFFQSDGISLGSQTLINIGFANAFVAKYDSAGDFVWARQGKINGLSDCTDIAVDHDGQVSFTGNASGSVLVFQSDTVLLPSLSEAYLAKMDAAGNVLFLKASSGTGSTNTGKAIAVDADNNLLVTGDFYSSHLTFGMDTAFNSATSCSNVFLAKFDPAGNPLWLRAPLYSNNCVRGEAVTTDHLSNVYLLGIGNNDSLGFGSLIAQNTGCFLVKYDSSGTALWVKSMQGFTQRASAVTVDSQGEIVISGVFSGILVVDNLTLTPIYSGYNGFVIKFDSGGNLMWGKTIPGPMNVFTHDHVVDQEGNIVVHGSFVSQVELHPLGGGSQGSNMLNALPNSVNPSFFVKYDAAGNYCNSFAMRTGGDDPQRIAIDSDSVITLCGDSGVDTLSLGSDTLLRTAIEDVMIARFSWGCDSIILPVDEKSSPEITVYPNPGGGRFFLQNDRTPVVRVEVFDAQGRMIFSGATDRISTAEPIEVNLERNRAGIYFMRLHLEGGEMVHKMIQLRH